MKIKFDQIISTYYYLENENFSFYLQTRSFHMGISLLFGYKKTQTTTFPNTKLLIIKKLIDSHGSKKLASPL